MVGRIPLEDVILVRVQVWQQSSTKLYCAGYFYLVTSLEATRPYNMKALSGQNMQSKAVKNLIKNITKTKLTIDAFLSSSYAAQALEDILMSSDKDVFSKDKTGKLLKRHLDHTKASKEDLYEMGFIKIFADFESFMYEFLIEKYSQNPNSIDKDKKIELGNLLDLKSIKEFRRNIVDEAAVADSWAVEKWEGVIRSKYRLEPFKDGRSKELFLALNEVRNTLMHTGGKASTKTVLKLRSINAEFVKRGEKIGFQKSELFKWSYGAILQIAERLK